MLNTKIEKIRDVKNLVEKRIKKYETHFFLYDNNLEKYVDDYRTKIWKTLYHKNEIIYEFSEKNTTKIICINGRLNISFHNKTLTLNKLDSLIIPPDTYFLLKIIEDTHIMFLEINEI